MGIGAVGRWTAQPLPGQEREEDLEIGFLQNAPLEETPENVPGFSLRVLTLNLAHGRKDGKHQMLQRKETIQGNLTMWRPSCGTSVPILSPSRRPTGPRCGAEASTMSGMSRKKPATPTPSGGST